jgi:hypothetical protein
MSYQPTPTWTSYKIKHTNNSYLRYKCKKLYFIARTGLKYDRGTRGYFKGCECNKGVTYRKYALKQGNRIGVRFIKFDIQGVFLKCAEILPCN